MIRLVCGIMLSLSMLPVMADNLDSLVKEKDGVLLVECDLATEILERPELANSIIPFNIVGKCGEDNVNQQEPVPIAGPIDPSIPFGPIGPWCDCTDKTFQKLVGHFNKWNIVVNPGYRIDNPSSYWLQAMKISQTDYQDILTGANKIEPDFSALRNRALINVETINGIQ